MTNPYDAFEQVIFSVFDAPVDQVASTVHRRWRESDNGRDSDAGDRYQLDRVGMDLRYAYDRRPKPMTQHGWGPSQLLFWEPVSSPNHTVMMTNATCGNSHAVFRMSEEVPWECIHIRLLDRDGEPENFMFNYYRDYRQIARSLGVGQEENGRWLFCADGPVQPFEDVSHYKRRRIVERLNRRIITEYLGRLNYEIMDDDFWTSTSKAWLLWDNCLGQRSTPGRDGIDEDGTRSRNSIR